MIIYNDCLHRPTQDDDGPIVCRTMGHPITASLSYLTSSPLSSSLLSLSHPLSLTSHPLLSLTSHPLLSLLGIFAGAQSAESLSNTHILVATKQLSLILNPIFLNP
jgi:hypothetical protein